MSRPNHLEIYRHLKKSNCGYCQVRTCMAFALAVSRGDQAIDDCPYVNPAIARELAGRLGAGEPRGDWRDELERQIEPLREAIGRLDFDAVAEGLGARLEDGRLLIFCLGKPFRVDREGRIESDIHVNPWLTVPLLKYIATAGRGEPAGEWIALDHLSSGEIRARYFNHRCEEPLRRLLDDNPGLFADLMRMFSADRPDGVDADRVWRLRPLPNVPLLLLYWAAEAEFDSKLKLLVDRRAETFLDPESIYILCRGIVEMLERLFLKHREGL